MCLSRRDIRMPEEGRRLRHLWRESKSLLRGPVTCENGEKFKSSRRGLSKLVKCRHTVDWALRA